jgi:hypothetical protein
VYKTLYKLLNEMNGSIKTFDTLQDMDQYLKENAVELPIKYELEAEKADGSFKDEETIHSINFINDDNSISIGQYYIYKHVRDNEIYYTYTKDFWSGSKHYKTFDECLLGWFDEKQKIKEEYEYEVSCYSCGDGGCIHCRPSWFM